MGFAIFRMDKVDEPIHHESPEYQDEYDIPTTKRVLYMNHHQITDRCNESKVIFVLIAKNQHMHLMHDKY